MYSATKDSSAYELEPRITKRAEKRNLVQTRSKRKRSRNMSSLLWIVTIFGMMFLICFRFVQIYGLHNEVETKTAILNNLQMENDQDTIALNEMVDRAKIEDYATNKLGLRKIENRQIVYLTPNENNKMEKVAKSDEKVATKGIFGMFSGVLEYLR